MVRPRRLVLTVAGLVAAVLLVRAEVAEPVRVSSDSMSPTLRNGDHVVLEKVTVTLDGVRRGQLVAFASPEDGALVLKRVVGVGGDTVEIRDALLYVSGRPVVEPGIDVASIDGTYFGPVTVGEGQVFVLGDNRANSVDSRAYGLLPVGLVIGRVLRPL
ncbi:MAG TPA: signal peptidase I, partial [Catenuloplanes sp.]